MDNWRDENGNNYAVHFSAKFILKAISEHRPICECIPIRGIPITQICIPITQICLYLYIHLLPLK